RPRPACSATARPAPPGAPPACAGSSRRPAAAPRRRCGSPAPTGIIAGSEQLPPGGDPMDDKQLMDRIGALVEEEHTLERQATGDALDETREPRRRDLEVQLAQCWDLLRQRRARRDAGQDPDTAAVRPEGTVEGYLQSGRGPVRPHA